MDAEDAVEAAAYEVLNVPALTDLAALFQHVPEDTPPPVVIIGDMDSDGTFGDKDGVDERISLKIIGLIAGEERRPLRAIKHQVKSLLNGHSETRDGWLLQFSYTGSDGGFQPSQSADDQDTYFENFRFSVLALSDA